MARMKPCPFCGGEPIMDHFGDSEGRGFYIHCDGCEVQQIANYTYGQAMVRWNKRHVEEPTDG